jgi:SAM-dependent methyltransferase
MTWPELSGWWRDEVASDPAYEDVVTPLLLDVMSPRADAFYLDLGCGEGRVMRSIRALGATVHGVDVSLDLTRDLEGVFVSRLPRIPARDDAYDGVYVVLTLEHIDDLSTLFHEAARVTKPGGLMAAVLNHPVWTAPGSTPISDDDGEVLWRPGAYFSEGTDRLPTPGGDVVFHHRPMSLLLNLAAEAGWSLQHMVEQPHHEYEDQAGIPRLLACRWGL